MGKDYDYILFDLDGTLTDPKPGITKSVQYALKHFEIYENDLDELQKFIGPPLQDSFRVFYDFNEDEVKKAVEKYREYFAEAGIYDNRVFPGIPELLKNLTKQGKKLILATSKPTFFAAKILKHFEIDDYFAYISGSNLDGSRTKKIEIINHTIDEFDMDNLEKIVMIGDRKYDIIGARQVGIDSIGVLYGYGSYKEISQEHPTFIAHTVSEVGEILGCNK